MKLPKATKQIPAVRRTLLSKHGLDPSRYGRWILKWHNLGCSARAKGVDSTITFEQYLRLAVLAGIKDPDEINRKGGYQMARKTDRGDYRLGTCRFLLQQSNMDELQRNGGAEAIRAKKLGKTKQNDLGRAVTSVKLARSFTALSPRGRSFEASNVKEFCKKRNIPYVSFCYCLRNGGSINGWSGHYT